jgi:hypothetical protein
MRLIKHLLFTLTMMVATNAMAADKCYYFAGAADDDTIHRVSISKDVLTVKKMGANFSEIKGLGCAYKVTPQASDEFIDYQVTKKLSGPCLSSLEISKDTIISISKQKDKTASKVNGITTIHVFVSDQSLWAHPCNEVDKKH